MSPFKKVPIAELKPGMYVIDTQKGQRLAPPAFSVEGYILNSGESERLRMLGYQYAHVDEARFMEPAADASANTVETLFMLSVSLQEEIEKARRLHHQAVESARAMRLQVSKGITQAAMQNIRNVLNEAIESLKRNENALLIMGKLRTADEYTFVHSVNVAMLSVVIGRRLKLSEAELMDVALAGFFHDIGKMLVPQDILNYPGKLSPEQYQIVKGHAELGCIFLDHCPQMSAVVGKGAIDHHERYDGSGYPAGKKGEAISLVGRILAVADVYDALSSRRCYKTALPPAKALAIIYASKDRDFSPGFVEAFIESMGVYPSGSLVRLSNNYLAVVVEQCANAPLKPKVVTLVDSFGDVIGKPKILDLLVHRNISIAEPLLNLPCPVDVEWAIQNAR